MPKLLLSIFMLSISCAQAQQQKPKLVVGIVVDQMRNDYLQRFEGNFEEGGFKRLIREGFYAKNNHYNYIPTYTAPGHASIYTGTTPKYHGVIANDWYSKVLGRKVYCVGDSTASNVGGTDRAGNISPRNLQSNTITDELKLSSNFKSKVYGISIKDRGSVLPAGHTPDGSYWYDSKTGEFMTSDYYTKELPNWVKEFNKKKLVNTYSNQVWKPLLPLAAYEQANNDDSPYEVGFRGKDQPTFPYDLGELRKQNGPYGLIRSTPFGNSLVLDLAKTTIEKTALGQSKETDFLAVSLSSTDYVGHNFGPNSIEIEDTYVRLDRDLAEFFTFLDKEVGKGNYLLFLTADHGVVENPQFLMDNNLPGGFSDSEAIESLAATHLKAKLGDGSFITSFSNGQLFLDEVAIKKAGSTVEETESSLSKVLLELPEVAEVYTASDMVRFEFQNPLAQSLSYGYNHNLSGNVLIVLKPGYLPKYGNSTKGTTHGSGYNYDTHVPLLFYGTGVSAGFTNRKTYITDIVPTLSSLLNISLPNAAVLGSPIEEIFE